MAIRGHLPEALIKSIALELRVQDPVCLFEEVRDPRLLHELDVAGSEAIPGGLAVGGVGKEA